MKAKLTFVILICAVITIFSVMANQDNAKMTEWEQNREVITVTVPKGVGIDYFGAKYAPKYLDIRKYREQIKELNDMKSSTLYVGQTLKVYKLKGE